MKINPSPVDAELRSMRECCAASERTIIDNLRANALNTRKAYADLLEKNPHDDRIDDGPQNWQRIIDTLVNVAAFYSPKKTKEVRAARERVNEITKEIADMACQMAKLLRARRDLCSRHGLSSPHDSHPVDVLHEASYLADEHSDYISNIGGLYRLDVAPQIEGLTERFGFRYWPRTADFLDALASMQQPAGEPEDDARFAATASREASARDFWRALHVRLDELHEGYGVNVEFSRQTMVDLTNATLNLDPPASLDNYKAFLKGSATKPELLA